MANVVNPGLLIVGACPSKSSSEYQLVFSIVATLLFKVVVTCANWQPLEGAVAKRTSMSSPVEGEVAEATMDVGLRVINVGSNRSLLAQSPGPKSLPCEGASRIVMPSGMQLRG